MSKCFWGHTYGKWKQFGSKTLYEKNRFTPDAEWHEVGDAILQERVCEKCGYKQINRQEIRNGY